MTVAFIGIGSNIGDRRANIRKALELLSHRVKISRISSLYETEPAGYADQPDYLNCAVSIDTYMSPGMLLRYLKKIEKEMGRKPDFRNAPRIIDLDILLFGNRVVEQDDLKIPHPRLHERAFVLVPLAEIAPDVIHPVMHANIKQLKDSLASGGRIAAYPDGV